MKRFLQVLIPLLLVAAIICSAVWYLFVYDRPMLENMMLHQARRFVQEGNYSAATWCYERAYSHSGQNKSIAIELANVYKNHGNYTKAEFTITEAITDGASAELYAALCQLYVEQDKLLDAVSMLDQISNPIIKAEIDAMRPAAPVVNPDPGFYNEYIEVALLSEGGTLYATFDGEYPSIADGAAERTITLGSGETTVYALSVADNGLVSPVTIAGYTIVGVVEDVSLSDASVDALVREALNLGTGSPMKTSDLWQIEELVFPEDATHYEEIGLFTQLHSLTLDNAHPENLDFLSSCVYLERLRISGTALSTSDLETIAALPMLKELILSDCNLSNITPLENAKGLTSLNLASNAIRNLEPLGNLRELEYLNLQHNALNSVSALAALASLRELDVSYNSLTSVSAISACTRLEYLLAAYNQIDSVSSLSLLQELRTLDLANNALEDAEALSHCTKLEELYLSHNHLTDITSLSTLHNLKYLYFAYNQVTALPQLPTDCGLISIDGSYNMLSSVEELAGMINLNYVYMDYNELIEDVASLADCYNLVRVDVYGTAVRDVSALTDAHDIIVNYTPYTPEESSRRLVS